MWATWRHQKILSIHDLVSCRTSASHVMRYFIMKKDLYNNNCIFGFIMFGGNKILGHVLIFILKVGKLKKVRPAPPKLENSYFFSFFLLYISQMVQFAHETDPSWWSWALPPSFPAFPHDECAHCTDYRKVSRSLWSFLSKDAWWN